MVCDSKHMSSLHAFNGVSRVQGVFQRSSMRMQISMKCNSGHSVSSSLHVGVDARQLQIVPQCACAQPSPHGRSSVAHMLPCGNGARARAHTHACLPALTHAHPHPHMCACMHVCLSMNIALTIAGEPLSFSVAPSTEDADPDRGRKHAVRIVLICAHRADVFQKVTLTCPTPCPRARCTGGGSWPPVLRASPPGSWQTIP